MTTRHTRRAWLTGLGVLLIALAIPAASMASRVGGESDGLAGSSASASPEQGSASSEPATAEEAAAPATVATYPIAGTEVAVPVPEPEVGSEVRDLEIPLEDADAVVRGVSFFRPGPMEGSVVGGVSVVYDDRAAVRSDDGGVADPAVIAELVNPELEVEVTTIGDRTVLAWPDSERIPSESIPQDDRIVSRYVVLLDEGILMVTFDDVAPQQVDAYLDALVGVL